jgi:hypothetical protein
MLVGVTLGAGAPAAVVRTLSLGDGRRFLSLLFEVDGAQATVNLSGYDEEAADYAIALADALYAAADGLRPGLVPLTIFPVAQECEL